MLETWQRGVSYIVLPTAGWAAAHSRYCSHSTVIAPVKSYRHYCHNNVIGNLCAPRIRNCFRYNNWLSLISASCNKRRGASSLGRAVLDVVNSCSVSSRLGQRIPSCQYRRCSWHLLNRYCRLSRIYFCVFLTFSSFYNQFELAVCRISQSHVPYQDSSQFLLKKKYVS